MLIVLIQQDPNFLDQQKKGFEWNEVKATELPKNKNT